MQKEKLIFDIVKEQLGKIPHINITSAENSESQFKDRRYKGVIYFRSQRVWWGKKLVRLDDIREHLDQNLGLIPEEKPYLSLALHYVKNLGNAQIIMPNGSSETVAMHDQVGVYEHGA